MYSRISNIILYCEHDLFVNSSSVDNGFLAGILIFGRYISNKICYKKITIMYLSKLILTTVKR